MIRISWFPVSIQCIYGRTLRERTKGYGNAWVYADKTYDALGRMSTETAPYKSGETKLMTTYHYDDNDVYKRLEKEVNSLGTTTFDYSYNPDLGLSIVSSTNPANQTTTVKTDARGKMVEKTDNGGTLYYEYDSNGNEKEVSDGTNVLVTTSYNDHNLQESLVDINGGTTTYTYDKYNRLASQTNANGEASSYTYDKLDRPLTEVLPEGTTTYDYYPTGSGASTNQLKKITSFSGVVEEYTYDNEGLLWKEEKLIDGTNHTFTYDYDAYDRLYTLQYPSGLMLRYIYDSNGYLSTIKDHNNSPNVIFEALSTNGYGQYKTYKLGNNKTSTQTFHHGIPTRYYTSGIQDLDMDWDYSSGNLNYREDNIKNKKENFTYDNLNRLKTSSGTGIPGINLNYEPNGNISSKTNIGSYTYDGSKINAVSFVTEKNIGDISTAQQDITYSSFLQPEEITELNRKLTYTYGSDLQRIKGEYKLNNTTQWTRYYFGDYEKVVDGTGTEHIHYISGGEGVVAIVSKKNNVSTFNYTYTDHLGSIVTVTNSSGTILHEQNYDPWGRERHPDTWTYSSLPIKPSWLYRGYTGHEMMPEFSLINMNGRMYDPMVGRMLSVDNFIHEQAGTQGYNRYSYALNNPLSYTDPDGEIIVPILIGAAVGVLTNGISNDMREEAFFSGAGKAAFWGGVGGAAGFGVGELFGATGTFLNEVGRAGAHALSGGLQSWGQGGNFWQGALSGGIGSGFGSGIDALKGGVGAQILGSGLGGGLGSSLSGGDFMQGFNQGIIVGATNHVMHGMVDELIPLKYSQKIADRIFKEAYGDLPDFTKLIADGSVPEGFYVDENGYARKPFQSKNSYTMGKTIMNGRDSKMYIFKQAFSSKNKLISTLGHEYFHARLNYAGITGAGRHHAAISLWQNAKNKKLGLSYRMSMESWYKNYYLKGYFNKYDLLLMPKL